jgi:hypothetical protein
MKNRSARFPVYTFVYARHGRELMGLESPVSVPCNVVKRNKITSRWQGRHREVRSEGSRVAKIWADEQKYHIRPSLWVSQHNMITPSEHEIR